MSVGLRPEGGSGQQDCRFSRPGRTKSHANDPQGYGNADEFAAKRLGRCRSYPAGCCGTLGNAHFCEGDGGFSVGRARKPSCQGSMFHGKGLFFERNGHFFQGNGRFFERGGHFFHGGGLRFQRNGLRFHGNGRFHPEMGISLRGEGVSLRATGFSLKSTGVSVRGTGVSFAVRGPALWLRGGSLGAMGCDSKAEGLDLEKIPKNFVAVRFAVK